MVSLPQTSDPQTQRLVTTVVGDCHEGDNTAVRGVRRTLCRPKYAEKDFERRPVTRIERKHPFSFPRAALTRRVTVGILITQPRTSVSLLVYECTNSVSNSTGIHVQKRSTLLRTQAFFFGGRPPRPRAYHGSQVAYHSTYVREPTLLL